MANEKTWTNVLSRQLLTDVLDWSEENIKKAILFKNSYTLILRKKKDGSLRKIYAPHLDLKRFQRRFLKYFLYRVPIDSLNISIKGFRPKSSYVDNAKKHAQKNVKFVLRLDFQDAFPSVKVEYLRAILKKVLSSEAKGYIEKIYQLRPLFSNKKVKWFRKLFRDLPQLNLFDDPLKILDEFVELILPLVTYQGKLPQGAPTSPYLLNIVLCYSGLLEKIYKFLWDNRILYSEDKASRVLSTVYADDLTFSFSEPISQSLINQLIDLIEQESPFKINRKKIVYFNRARIAPLVTGLRLVRLIKTGVELKKLLSKENLTDKQKKNILRRTLNKKGQWIVASVGLSKKQIRRIRGLIHRAIFKKALASTVEGHIANLKAIYGDNLPRQISVPYQKYLNSLEG